MSAVYTDAGVAPTDLPEGLEVVTRHGTDAVYRIAVNHNEQTAELAAHGHELLSDTAVENSFTIAPGGVAVIRTTH